MNNTKIHGNDFKKRLLLSGNFGSPKISHERMTKRQTFLYLYLMAAKLMAATPTSLTANGKLEREIFANDQHKVRVMHDRSCDQFDQCELLIHSNDINRWRECCVLVKTK